MFWRKDTVEEYTKKLKNKYRIVKRNGYDSYTENFECSYIVQKKIYFKWSDVSYCSTSSLDKTKKLLTKLISTNVKKYELTYQTDIVINPFEDEQILEEIDKI